MTPCSQELNLNKKHALFPVNYFAGWLLNFHKGFKNKMVYQVKLTFVFIQFVDFIDFIWCSYLHWFQFQFHDYLAETFKFRLLYYHQ